MRAQLQKTTRGIERQDTSRNLWNRDTGRKQVAHANPKRKPMTHYVPLARYLKYKV